MRVRVMEGSLRVRAELVNTSVSNAGMGVVASGDSSCPSGG